MTHLQKECYLFSEIVHDRTSVKHWVLRIVSSHCVLLVTENYSNSLILLIISSPTNLSLAIGTVSEII